MHRQTIGLIDYLFRMIRKVFMSVINGVAGLKFQDRSEYIGTFVLMYLSIGGGLVMMWMILGLNPTLILSVIAAPIWIFIVWVSNNLTKAIINDRKRRKK
jgi:LytS/YehU family sensor histidine kinase|tara:strand:- start:192 stop:491 length:300 start_codon:yes stop_codon:yes gene_type:complete